MKSLTIHRWFAGIGTALLLAPAMSMAQQADNQGVPTHQQLEEAYAACGGPPIQNGRSVQPTPERDKCLSEHLEQAKRQAPHGNRARTTSPPPSTSGREEMPAGGQGR